MLPRKKPQQHSVSSAFTTQVKSKQYTNIIVQVSVTQMQYTTPFKWYQKPAIIFKTENL